LLHTVTIEKLDGAKNIQVLFDTGANVFILNQERAQIHNIFVKEWEKPITLLGFSGQEETSFGKYFAPLLNLRIEDYIFQIS
jgi:predicted aspartyl protease